MGRLCTINFLKKNNRTVPSQLNKRRRRKFLTNILVLKNFQRNFKVRVKLPPELKRLLKFQGWLFYLIHTFKKPIIFDFEIATASDIGGRGGSAKVTNSDRGGRGLSQRDKK